MARPGIPQSASSGSKSGAIRVLPQAEPGLCEMGRSRGLTLEGLSLHDRPPPRMDHPINILDTVKRLVEKSPHKLNITVDHAGSHVRRVASRFRGSSQLGMRPVARGHEISLLPAASAPHRRADRLAVEGASTGRRDAAQRHARLPASAGRRLPGRVPLEDRELPVQRMARRQRGRRARVVELRGLEPLTCCLQSSRSTT
jgi:hypothetical protein